MIDLALLLLRVTVGSLLAGHGAQKLFGSFGGSGLEGTSGWLESMGFRPGRRWAFAAGGAEFGGGLLTALGLLNPLGPVTASSSMVVAVAKAHKGKPIWVTAGGAELPITNLAALGAVALAGPGAFSLDRAFGVRIPAWVSFLATAGTAWFTWMSIQQSEQAPQEAPRGAEAEPERMRESVTPPSSGTSPEAGTENEQEQHSSAI